MMSADDFTVDNLKLYWDYFFKAETGTYEKSIWLDLFLAEFLLRLKDGGHPSELIKFCPISCIVTLVGCELLCGIHRVSSATNTQYTPPLLYTNVEPVDLAVSPAGIQPDTAGPFAGRGLPSSAEILQKYVLCGVAWRCLVLLKALGVEGLSCCRQLSSVLIWLFGELSGNESNMNLPRNPHIPPTRDKEPIYNLFSNKVWSKKKFNSRQSKITFGSPDKSSTSSRSKSIVTAKPSDIYSKKKVDKEAAVTSESGSSNEDLQTINRSLAIKVVTPKDDFEYFNSSVTTGDEHHDDWQYKDPFRVVPTTKPRADDYMTDKHREIINSDITPFEFTLMITDLLQELCKAESSLSGAEGSQISVQCVNFSLHNLCALQFGSSPVYSVRYNAQEVSRVKVALTELLIVSLDKVLIRPDLCAKLITNGILPMLLRILEDCICKLKNRFCSKESQTRPMSITVTIDSDESDNILKFIFGIAYSITAFFYCLLMQCRTVAKLKEFTEQFKLYADCQKGGLLKECMELMMRIPGVNIEEVSILIKKLVESIGRLVSSMKRVRSEVVHSAACPRNKHKICRQRVLAGMHHHHDVLGEANMSLAQISPCCISVLYSTLTSILIDEYVSAQSALRTKILRVMLSCGVCCCISPGLLMENIVRLMLTHCGVASLCLTVLEHTVYGDLGASLLMARVTDQLPCVICEPNEIKRQGQSDYKYCSHVSTMQKKNVWSFLIHYNSLLQLDNHNRVLHSTVSHLLRVTPKCRTEMKYELLFSVIYPTFIVAKHRYIIRLEESAYFLTVSCLNIFASLLNTVSFAEQFIQKGGLSYVLELVSLPEFSKQCCSILEIAIIVEIFKLVRDNSADMTYFGEIATLSSVQMLLKALEDMGDKCLKIYRLKLPRDKFEELCDLSKENNRLGSGNLLGKKGSSPKDIQTNLEEVVLEETIEDYMEMLKTIWTFWKSCAGLCLYSPMFRRYLASEGLFMDTYRILKVLFYYLRNFECNAMEMRLLIKILESLLTIQFAVSDTTMHNCKEVSTSLIRDMFVTERGAGSGDDAECVRALCEMLIRVATTCASADHVMPPLNKAKLPPLLCVSSHSSLEESSSEDSGAPSASEHSDYSHITPDDGYEADLEAGMFEIKSHRSRKSSLSIALGVEDLGHTAAELDTFAVDCNEYTKTSAVTHPELCIIVVDILTQLIQKLLEAKKCECASERDDDLSLSRAGVSLARACCARLSAAFARLYTADKRVAAPLHLIHRILSGAAAALLAQRSQQLEELQRSILELVLVLASQSIESSELACYLQLLKAPQPPLHILLDYLQRMVDSLQPDMPDCVLSFPVHRLNNDVLSGWWRSQAALGCSAEGVGWSIWLTGFGVMLWLTRTSRHMHYSDEECQSERRMRSEDGPQPDSSELVHVFSIGHDSLMFQMWMDTLTGSFTFRLSRPDGYHSSTVSEARVESVLPSGRCSCVAFNVKDVLYKRKIHIQVTVFMNGRECETVSLPLQGILMRKAMPVHVLLGESREGSGVWSLGSVAVVRGPVLTTYTVLHTTARGPTASLLHSQIQSQIPNYRSLLTRDILDCNIDWDQLLDMSNVRIRELQDNLLLTYSAQFPNIMNLYHQTVSSPTEYSGAIPETLSVVWSGGPLASQYKGLPTAALMLGGPDVFLYMFARVVEVESTGEEQARALSIVMDLCRLDNRLYTMFHNNHSLSMLQGIMATDKCIKTHHLLKVFLDAACSSSVLTVTNGRFYIMTRSDAVIIDPVYLVFLVRAWKELEGPEDNDEEVSCDVSDPPSVWMYERVSGGGGGLVGTLLMVLRVLLRSDHHRRTYNLYQLDRHNLMQHLLLAAKERFLNSPRGELSWSVSCGLVEAVRALLSSPPKVTHIALLMDFLLLLHQASDTFVTHSRSNFYFLVTAETQASSVFSRHSFMTKRTGRARLGRRKAQRVGSLTKEPGYLMVELKTKCLVSETVSENTESSTLKTAVEDVIPEPESLDNSPKETLDDAILEGDSSVDSTKQLKGLINTHIKENSLEVDRKHNRSSLSTSEPSDGTLEENSIQESINNEYVVIDYDQVEKTKPELDTGGICNQSIIEHMPAGCRSWGVVEGLLLLLHDIIKLIPDNTRQELSTVVQEKVVVVLGNHRSAGVRAAVVRLLSVLSGVHHQGLLYHHLANQISLYPASWELVAACAELITECDAGVGYQLQESVWSDLPVHRLTRASPLLALLPASLHDLPLAHNMTLLINRIIDKASVKVISELAVVEVVTRSLRSVGSTVGRDLILGELRMLLNRVAVKALMSHHNMQTVNDIHHLLSYMELTSSCCITLQTVMRDTQCILYIAQLQHLEDRLHTHCTATTTTTTTNYFSTVLSLSGESGAGPARSELAGLHRVVLARGVHFIITRDPQRAISTDEAALVERLYNTLLNAVGESDPLRSKRWLSSASECLPALLDLFQWMISPGTSCDRLRALALRRAYRAPPATQDLLTPTDPGGQRKLAVYILCILKAVHASPEPALELAITDWARTWALHMQAQLAERVHSDSLADEADALAAADDDRRAERQRRHHIAKVAFGREALADKLIESAMSMTRRVVDLQNSERKGFMEHLRREQTDAALGRGRWRRLVDTYCHERGLWHDPDRQPGSWELDPVEGPGRVRVRLRRCRLDIDERFLKEGRSRSESSPPLRWVAEGAARGGVGAGESVGFMARVTHVTVAADTGGDLLLTDRCIHFVPERSSDGTVGDPEPSPALSWPLDAVTSVVTRRWCLRERAVELFLNTGHAHLVAFDDRDDRNAFLRALDDLPMPNRSVPETLSEATNLWRNGLITNWEYLMKLNGFGGRSYNDLMQYPVLPFVLADYTSRILNLNAKETFRDLGKPMAVQNKNKEIHYINTYNDLVSARREGSSPVLSRQPHHYPSLYSNSGAVLHYLLRLPPFTKLFLSYQDNNFDMPDRTFHSLQTTWRLITNDSPTDVKELIPEFYYLPEFLKNDEGLNLGVRQCGLPVEDVELPPWAPDARLFTLVHRQALEATHVTDRLPHWIDLVFGYKQTGQQAVDAINVFPACTYYGFEPSSLPDEVSRCAAAAMVRTYGQVPRQLIRQPHPHVVADLAPHHPTRAIWPGLEGGRWGTYCGSPDTGPPVAVLTRTCASAVRLLPLATPRTVLVGTRGSILIQLNETNKGTGTGTLSLLSWGHSDSTVRLKRRRDTPPDLMMHVPALDAITSVVTCCLSGGRPVVFGYRSGRVLVVSAGSGRVLAGSGRVLAGCGRELSAHSAPIVDMCMCTAFGLLVTASEDGLVVVWDLNTLSYVRSVPNRTRSPVSVVSVSPTLADIASVHPLPSCDRHRSSVRVHTVNGCFVSSVRVMERVTCVCYSGAPEGVSVNCVAVGLDSGGVKLFSSWDLTPVTYIPPLEAGVGLVSIAYSSESGVLFTGLSDGRVVCWESSPSGTSGTTTIRVLSANNIL